MRTVTSRIAPALANRAEDQPPPDTSLTWSVSPTPKEDDPQRPNFNYDAKEGDTINDSIRVQNYGTKPLPLRVYASDALNSDSGSLDLLHAVRAILEAGHIPFIGLDAGLGLESLRPLGIAGVIGGDLVAILVQQLGNRGPDASGTAGDDCDA